MAIYVGTLNQGLAAVAKIFCKRIQIITETPKPKYLNTNTPKPNYI